MKVYDMAILEEKRSGLFSSLSEEASRVAERVRQGVVVVRGDGGGHGSGVVWQQDGVILTNDHVVARDRAEVSLADGREFQAEVFRRDEARDLAAMRIPAIGLPAVPVADSRLLRPGELIMAVGNPLGVKRAVTVGIVSAAPREVWIGRRRLPEMVQADVDLFPGNSGGPLVNAEGMVVGINSMVMGPGIALAVPSHVAVEFLAEDSRRAYLGVTLRGVELPEAIAQPLGISSDQGLMVFELAESGPADRAGLLPGDLLIALDGHVLDGTSDLSTRLSRIGSPGSTRLTVLRGGKLLDLTAVPEEREQMARAA
jgi:serine protease Do